MNTKTIEEHLNISFNDPSLLKKAFTHRSYVNENRDYQDGHNERLEFLGDAVLELAVTQFLYEEFPNKPEGELTAYRAALVNTDTLAKTASSLGFNDFIRLSRGESKDTGRARHYILADMFEAVVGAIHMDSGYAEAHHFIKQHIFPQITEIIEKGTWLDAKSKFQEVAQEQVGVTPEYKTIDSTGPDHDKEFTIGVFLQEAEIAQGKGKSKQDAEQVAARKALALKGWI